MTRTESLCWRRKIKWDSIQLPIKECLHYYGYARCLPKSYWLIVVLSQVLQRCVHIPVSLNCKLLVWSMVCRIMGAPPEDVHSLIPLGLHHLAEGNEGRSSPHQNRDIILHYPGGPSVIEWVLNRETGRQKRKVRGSCDCGRRSA